MKWEYKSLYAASEKRMNKLGRKGWELIAISPYTYYIFKRPIKERIVTAAEIEAAEAQLKDLT